MDVRAIFAASLLSRGATRVSTDAWAAERCDDRLMVRFGDSPFTTALGLPPPRRRGGMSLAEALDRRRSVREFSEDRLSPEALSQLLWSAQGTTTAWGARTAPSAGALYPLELYLLTPEGLWRYLPREHHLRTVSQGDLRPALARAALGQAAVEDAPAVFLVAGVFERTSAKYGSRAARYVMLEAGHVAQNVLLGAVALDLAAVPVGAFDDERVRLALGLRSGEEPLYLVAVGHPAVHRP